MKIIKSAFFIALLLFAFSVILKMYSMVALDEEATLFSLSLSTFMVPLLSVNLIIIFFVSEHVPKKGFSLCVVLWIIFVPLFSIINGADVNDIIRVSVWPTTYLASYKLVKWKNSFFKEEIVVFCIIFLISLYFFVQGKIDTMSSSAGLKRESNAVLCLITVLPFILCLKSRSLKILSLVIITAAVVFSNKRSATLMLIVAVIPTVIGIFASIKSKVSKFLAVVVFVSIVVYSFVYLSDNYLDSNIVRRFSDISENGGSGRIEIWQAIIKALDKSDSFAISFGHGHYAVSNDHIYTAAHNDFLDVIYDYGVLVLLVYLVMHFQILKRCWFLYKQKSVFFASYFFMTVVFVIMSWISILIVQQRYLIYMALYFGAIEALCETGNFYDYQNIDKPKVITDNEYPGY